MILLHDLQLLTKWDSSWADKTARNVCGVGSAHNRHILYTTICLRSSCYLWRLVAVEIQEKIHCWELMNLSMGIGCSGRWLFLPCIQTVVEDGPWLNGLSPFGFFRMCDFLFYCILFIQLLVLSLQLKPLIKPFFSFLISWVTGYLDLWGSSNEFHKKYLSNHLPYSHHKPLHSYIINIDFTLLQSHETTSTLKQCLHKVGINFDLLMFLYFIVVRPKGLK